MPVSERPTREKSESIPLTILDIEAGLEQLKQLAERLKQQVHDLPSELQPSPPAGSEDESDDESDDDDDDDPKNPHKIILSTRRTVDVPLVTVNPQRNSKMAVLLAKLASG